MYRKGLFQIGQRISVHQTLFSIKKKSASAISSKQASISRLQKWAISSEQATAAHVQSPASSLGVQLAAQNNYFSDAIPLQQICDM
jgi:hypothetical protein